MDIFTTFPFLPEEPSQVSKIQTETQMTSTEEIQTETPTEKHTFIPIEEAKKEIILVSLAATLALFVLIAICVTIRRHRRERRDQIEFDTLAASSSTTVFNKNQ